MSGISGVSIGGSSPGAPDFASVGTLSGWVEDMTMSASAVPGQPVANDAATQSDDSGSTAVNQVLSSATTSTTQNGASISVLVTSSTFVTPGQNNSSVSIAATALVTQAVDEALNDWGASNAN